MRLCYVASFDIVKMRLYYASAEHVHVHCNVKRVIEGELVLSSESVFYKFTHKSTTNQDVNCIVLRKQILTFRYFFKFVLLL